MATGSLFKLTFVDNEGEEITQYVAVPPQKKYQEWAMAYMIEVVKENGGVVFSAEYISTVNIDLEGFAKAKADRWRVKGNV